VLKFELLVDERKQVRAPLLIPAERRSLAGRVGAAVSPA